MCITLLADFKHTLTIEFTQPDMRLLDSWIWLYRLDSTRRAIVSSLSRYRRYRSECSVVQYITLKVSADANLSKLRQDKKINRE